jgi:hypothetical protein
MDWLVIADLVGTLVTCVGGVVLAIPAFRDNFDRSLRQGIASSLSRASSQEAEMLNDAAEAIEEAAIAAWIKDRRLLRIGIVLVVIGLALSIPVKFRDGLRPAHAAMIERVWPAMGKEPPAGS